MIIQRDVFMELADMIAAVEPDFNAERNLLGSVWNGPGYHSRVPNGSWVHQTRLSIYYALALLDDGRPEYLERAAKVIRAVLKSQVTDPYDPAYGIWPWLDEEPVAQMAPPDWNWADFIGSGLCHMLVEHPGKLDAELKREITAALERAAWSIFRRNIQPSYTNIALMGAAVTGCAGEILDNAILREYAKNRLAKFLAYTRETGGINEYNSPTYTFVALFEVERILQLVREPETRSHAGELLRLFWNELANHFHPATGQLGGPQSRAYGDFLPEDNARFIREATGVEIPIAAPGKEGEEFCHFTYSGIRHRPCPPDIAVRFARLPEPETEVALRCIRRQPDTHSTYCTTFLNDDFVVGSASVSIFWIQSRPLLGYWRVPGMEMPAQFRFRFLRDNRDFSSAQLYSRQCRNRILCGVGLRRDLGDHHPGLDRPADGVFHFERLAACFELTGKGAEVSRSPDGTFTLRLGSTQAVIRPGSGVFSSVPVRWECSSSETGARVEAVFYAGPSRSELFDERTELTLACGVEVLPAGGASEAGAFTESVGPESVTAAWGGLALEFPRFAQKEW